MSDVCMRDACGMEARYVGGMRCGFVDLMTFLFMHLVRLGLVGARCTPALLAYTPSRCHAVISPFSLHSPARGG